MGDRTFFSEGTLMNRIVLALFAAMMSLALSAPARAQTHKDVGGTVVPGTVPLQSYKSAGLMQSISAGTLAAATNLSPPLGATVAQICVETAGVRYRDDGTSPTASVGMPAVAGTNPYCFQYAGPLTQVQFILISGSPTMDVSYYVAN